MTSTYISSYLVYPPNLPDEHISAIAGALINRLFLNEPIPRDKFSDITYEQEFYDNSFPKNKLIKMSKTKYIDDFFENGKLQLGTFKSFSQYENPEIGDKSEGSTMIVGRNNKQTAFVKIGSGYNNFVFCCYDGEANPEVLEKFGYDDYFEIVDIEGFSEAIKNYLQSSESFKARCIYKSHKVLVGNTPEDFDFSVVSSKLSTLVNFTKYFIKTNEYRHQNEFRFIWETEQDVVEPLIIECKEAIKFCKRKS